MRRYLHISFVVLLGLSVLAGCRRADEPMPPVQPEQVTDGQVQVSLTLSLHGFGSDGVITKADYEDVETGLRYAYEKNVSDYGIFVFDATRAFMDDGSGKYIFDPTQAYRLSTAEEAIAHKEQLGVLSWRHELKLNTTYKSLAVLVLANLGVATYTDPSIPGQGSTLKDVTDYFNNTPIAVSYETDQSKYLSGAIRIPMYGFQVFGSWEGLSTDPTDPTAAAKKNAVELKYYSGMATPLTIKGFRTQTELENYFASGAVRAADRLALRFAMARLHVRYEPGTGQPSATPASGVASVKITSVRLKNYDEYVRVLPPIFSGLTEVSPFTAVPAALSLNTTGTINFVHPSTTDASWVAYVPEMKVTGATTDPALIVDVTVTDTDGNEVYYTFERDKITRKWKWDDNGTKREETRIYKNSPWTEWLQMQTYYTNLLDSYPKKYPGTTTDVPLLTYYNLVRNYSYEWVAYGVEGMNL